MWGQTAQRPEDAGSSRTKSPRSLSTAAVGIRREQKLGQGPNGLAGLWILGHPRRGAPAGVEDRRVVAAAEPGSDRGQGLLRVLAREVHGDLPRPGDAVRAVLGQELLAREVEPVRDELLDALDARRRAAGPGRAAV